MCSFDIFHQLAKAEQYVSVLQMLNHEMIALTTRTRAARNRAKALAQLALKGAAENP